MYDYNNISIFKKTFFSYLFLVSATIFLPNRQALFVVIFLIAAFQFYRLKRSYGKVFIQFFIIVFVLFILQTIFFERFRFSSAIRLFLNIFLPYFLIKIIGPNYLKFYIKLIYYIAIISLIFYIPSLFSNDFHELIGKIAPLLGTDKSLSDQNFIIYTWEAKSDFFLRNSGNFTEPGYFASMLNLALVYNVLHGKNFFSKKNIVFIIAIITTFSTAGYIGLFFIATSHYLLISAKKYKYALIPIMVLLSFQVYTKLDFLQNKVTRQYETQVENGSPSGRFGSALLDIQEIKKYPLIGRGLTKATRFDEVDYWVGDEAPRPIINSITDTILKYGILGFGAYLFFLISSIKIYLKKFGLSPKGIYMVLGSLFIIAFSQPILLTPIFLSLIYFKDLVIFRKPINFSNAKTLYHKP